MSRFLGTVLGADTLLGEGKSSHHGIQFRCTMVTESINKFVRDSIASNHGINGFFRIDYLELDVPHQDFTANPKAFKHCTSVSK